MKGMGPQMAAIIAGALLGVVSALYIVYMSEETRVLETSADDMNLIDLLYIGRNAQRYAELSQDRWEQEAARTILRQGGLGGCGLVSVGELDFVRVPCEEPGGDLETGDFVQAIAINELSRYAGAWRASLELNQNILKISREITSEHHIYARFNFSLNLPEPSWSELEPLLQDADQVLGDFCIEQTNYRIYNGTTEYAGQDTLVRRIQETGDC